MPASEARRRAASGAMVLNRGGRRGRGVLERARPEDAGDLLTVERLALQEGPGQRVELVDVVGEDLARAVGALEYNLLDLAVDQERRVLAVVLGARHLATEEDVLLVLAEGQRPQVLGHPPLADHLA